MGALYVVIATAGRSSLLGRTLDTLIACKKPDSYKRTIVVENGPRGIAERLVRGRRDLLAAEYVHYSEANKSGALNHVLQRLDDGLVVFFDDDVRVHPEALTAYDAAARQHEQSFFGGPVDVDYEVPPADWLKEYLPGSAKGWGLRGIENENHPWFIGLNWAAPVKNLKVAGGFDITRGPGTLVSVGDEVEMQRRLVDGGCKRVFLPDARAWHYVPTKRCSPKWALKRKYRHGLAFGLNYDNPGRKLLGVHRWMWHRLYTLGIDLYKQGLRRDWRGAYQAAYELMGQIGIMRGLSYQK